MYGWSRCLGRVASIQRGEVTGLRSIASSILFWLLLTSGVALVWPTTTLGFDPFASNTWLLWSLIVVTMFSLGTLVQPKELRPLRQHPWWVVLGLTAQVVVMPLAAWTVVRLLPMEEELAAGIILVGCVPGAMASNVLTSTAGGSVAYSVSLTSTATLLSPLSVPLVMWMTMGQQSQESLMQSSMLLAFLVVLPTILGYLLARRFSGIAQLAGRFGSLLASIALLWIIATVVAANRDRLLDVGGGIVAALLLINVVGYISGYGIGYWVGLPTGYRRALTLEVGMQNAGLGTTLAASLYGPDTIATIPTAAYTLGCMLTGTVLAVFWKRRDTVTGQESVPG